MNESFSDLPDALVQDLLKSAIPISEEAKNRFNILRASREELRRSVQQISLVRRRSDLEITREPSVAGIDGSYQLHRLTSVDLCAAAAVGVEGTAKEARRHWEQPYHRVWAKTVSHNEDTTSLLRGLMVCMELELSRNAPHDLVLLDGSFASLIIYLNQGLSNLSKEDTIGVELKQLWETQNLLQELINALADNRFIAIPKYTSRNELSNKLKERNPSQDRLDWDGRTLATLILEPGEYTEPLPIYEGETFNLPRFACSSENQEKMNSALSKVQVIYFRPFRWVPALRLEVPDVIASDPTRLSMSLRGIESQLFSPAVVEPYPLFLADRMVKSLGAGVNVIEQTISQYVTDNSDDVELTMLLLQNYRTESGRGGV